MNQRINELLDHIARNADAIFVREQVDGKWDSYALVELPANLAILHVCHLIRKNLDDLKTKPKRD